MPPANVLVAVVLVAVMYATVGLVEEFKAPVPPFEYSQPWPKVEAPVPPFNTDRSLLRFKVPIYATVDEAMGKVLVAVVLVAMKYEPVGLEEPTRFPF